MNKKSNIILFIVLFVLNILYLLDILTVSLTITYISIGLYSLTFLLCIISLMIIDNSKLKNELYNKQSSKDNSMTLLDELLSPFFNSAYVMIGFIILTLLLIMLNINRITEGLTIAMLVINFSIMIDMYRTITLFIRKDSTFLEK